MEGDELRDFEKEIPVNNLQVCEPSSELRIKVVQANEQGFSECKYERVKLQENDGVKRKVCIARPIRQSTVADTISLAIEDLKQVTEGKDCWRVFDCSFRRVLIYGKADVLNYYSKDGGIRYKILVDDGSESIIATMNITKKEKDASKFPQSEISLRLSTESIALVSAQSARLTLDKNWLKQKRKVGLNIRGKFLPPDSVECQSLIKSAAVVQSMTEHNIQHQSKEFPLGPIPEKVQIHGFPYKVGSDQIQLHVVAINRDDKIELAWKRELNRVYENVYLKKTI